MEGNVFAEGDKVNFVVAADNLPAGVDDERGVVVVPGILLLREIGADAANHERRLRAESDGAHGLLEAEIVFDEGRGRFGPDDEVGMGGIRRADDFALGRAGLRNAGYVGFALLAGEAREFGDMAVPFGALPVVACAHVEIGLNEDGGGSGVSVGRRNKDTGKPGDEQNSAASGPCPAASEAAFGAAVNQQYTGEERVDSDENEGNAVDASKRREVIDEGVVDLRVAELVPGNAGDARGSEVKAGPEKRRKGQSHARGAGSAADQQNSKAEEAEVESEDEAVSKSEQFRRQGRHVAVAHHGVANPVAVAHVPEDAANVGDEERATERMSPGGIRDGEESP